MLKFLGRFLKGFATIIGSITAVIGVLGIGGPGVISALKDLGEHLPAVIAAAGVILASFGVGRKAGYKANE